MTFDIIFCNVPYTNIEYVYSAPAILKGIVSSHGYTAKTHDFMCDLYDICDRDYTKFYRLQNYFITPDTGTPKEIQEFYQQAAEYFQKNKSMAIGVSVMSFQSHKCAIQMCEIIRKNFPDRKIYLGGRGILPPTNSIIARDFSVSVNESLLRFGDFMKRRGLADEVVYGDGEDAVLDLLGTLDRDLSQPLIAESNQYPVPDFDDYDWSAYDFGGGAMELPITGSKGCVRDCDFCDVKDQFGKFRYRSGADVANEMIALAERYQIRKFKFTDSLVNGGLKPFTDMLGVLAAYNDSTLDKRLTWNGQYICRNRGQTPDEIYPLLVKSGAHGLTIGVESGSDDVLLAMNKKMNVDGLFCELEKFREHGLTCTLLMFVGHWSEDHDDFIKHCEMLLNIMPYVRSGTISSVTLGSPYHLSSVTSTERVPDVKTATFNRAMAWFTPVNPSNTLRERIYRRLVTGEIAKRVGMPTILDASQLRHLATVVEAQCTMINDFYESVGAVLDTRAESYLNQFDEFYANLAKSIEREIVLNIALEASACNSDPEFEVLVNGSVVLKQQFNQGAHQIRLTVPTADRTRIEMSMTNKTTGDTKVDSSGKIIADKYILVKELTVNQYSLLDDYDFCRHHVQYLANGVQEQFTPGFWKNASLVLEFDGAFNQWYNSCSNRNRQVTDSQIISGRSFAVEEQLLINNVKKLSR